jgi:hypothetical protein
MYTKGGQPSRTDLLIVIDQTSPIHYKIKCGGRIKPEEIEIPGYMIPIATKNELRMRQASDHYNGCSDLNYQLSPETVKKYAKLLDLGYKDKKIYIEDALSIRVDQSNIMGLKEGFTPVVIQGKMICGATFTEPTLAVITSGNCV